VANYSTVRDLRNDALWVAGEAQTSASSYYARSLEYLNAVLIALLAGGPLGALDLPAMDWWWAYRQRRGQLSIDNAVNTAQDTSITLTLASNTATFNVAPTLPLQRYRLALMDDQDQLFRVYTHDGGSTSATIDFPWGKATRTTAGWVAWKDQYQLPVDFVRFATPLKIGRYPYEIELCDMNVLEQRYPRSRLWLGTPQCAAIVSGEAEPSFNFAFGAVDVAGNFVTRTGHGLSNGDGPVRLSKASGSLPGGLAETTDYWLIRLTANTFSFATSFDNAMNNTPVDITTQGNSPAVTITGYKSPFALHFSHMLQDGPIVAEYEYLTRQTELVDTLGTEEPFLPFEHRRVLSLGAAYLMLFDKVDSKYQQVGKMFESAWQAMAETQYRQATDNQNFGRILSRPMEVSAKRMPLRSPSGFIYG